MTLLQTLQTCKAQLITEPSPPTDQRSAYNFVYGLSLALLFKKLNLIKSVKGKTNTAKLKNTLQQVEQIHNKSYFVADLANYTLDDKTLSFCNDKGYEVLQTLKKAQKGITLEEFWKAHEEFFIGSF